MKKNATPFRTLADIGLTPSRAWALHQYVACHEEYQKADMWTVWRGLKSGAVRVLHESFGLLVVYVASTLVDEKGQPVEKYTDAVIAVVPPEKEEATMRFSNDWRIIGCVISGDGTFEDALAMLADEYPDLVPHEARGAA